MYTSSTWSVDVHLVLWVIRYFLSTFSTFPTSFFPGSIITRINTLWVQLLLEFSTDHFHTMRTRSTSSVDVHVVLG